MTALRVDADAAELRRELGPVPWFVLEELLLSEGEQDGDVLVVHSTVRALARSLSLNKDTVARALSMLRQVVAVASPPQPNDGGRFGTGCYRVGPVPGIHRIEDLDRAPRRSRPARSRPITLELPRETTQLSLIDQRSSIVTDHSRPTTPTRPKQDDALAPGVRPGPAGRRRDAGGTDGTAAGPC